MPMMYSLQAADGHLISITHEKAEAWGGGGSVFPKPTERMWENGDSTSATVAPHTLTKVTILCLRYLKP